MQKKILKAITILFFGIAGVAKATVTLEPITWNVIGLDSNKPDTAQPNPQVFPPDRYPVGVEVCNTSATDTESDLKTVFVWDETPATSYVELWDGVSEGSSTDFTELTVPELAPGQCQDVYYFVRIDRVKAAYNFTRDYYIQVWDDPSAGTPVSDGGTLEAGTAQPRELFVEYLVSQNRNAILGYTVDGVSVAPGGSVAVKPGDTIELVIDGKTATQGYEQLEVFMALPPDLFTINSVRTTYSANSGTDPDAGEQLYADGCGWENDPESGSYHNNLSCSGTGKYGGTIQQTYSITIAPTFGDDAGRDPIVGQTLIYDYSGSSYHYNSDYEDGGLTFTAGTDFVPSGDLGIFKSADTQAQDEFFLTVTNEGSNTFPAGNLGYVIEDELPIGYEIKSGSAASQVSLEEYDSAGVLKVAQDYATQIALQVEFYNLSANQDGGPDQSDGPDYDSGERHIIWTPNLLNELAPGESVRFSFQVAPDRNAVGENIYTNCAVIVTDDDDASNNSSCATLPPPDWDLAVTKQVTSVVGDTVVFALSVTNDGPDPSVATVLEDLVPSGYDFDQATGYTYGGDVTLSESPRADGSDGVQVLLWNLPPLTVGQSATVSYSATVLDPTGTETNQDDLDARYLNTARILDAASELNNGTYDPVTDRVSLLDGDPNNNTASASAAPTLLEIDKSPNTGTITGTTYQYTLAVSKVGAFLAGDVITLVEAPPPGMTITAISGSGWDCTAAPALPTDENKTCVRTVAGGDPDTYPDITVDVELTPLPNGATTYINTSFVEATRGGNTLFNTFDSDSVEATTLEADLSLLKTVSNSTPNVGDVVTFTLSVINDGPDTATNVEVTDIVPSGYTYVASSIAGGTSRNDANPSGSGLVWTMASINSGSSATLTFDATVNVSGNYVNSAQVTASDQPDPDSTPDNDTPSEDDQDSASATPSPVIDLSVSKVAAPGTVEQGTDTTFTIRVENAGPSDATGVDIVDTLPAGLTYVVGTASDGGMLSGSELQWSGLSISAGNFVELTYAATVSLGTHTNFVEVAAANQDDIDSAPGNGDGSTPAEDDEATATVEGTTGFVAAPALALIKTGTLNDDDGTPGVSAGDTISYAFTVTNTGNIAVTNITLADTGATVSGGPIASLAVGASDSTTFTAEYVVTQTDIDAGTYTNTATVTGDGTGTGDVTADNDDTQPLAQTPALTLVKAVTAGDPYAAVGDVVSYSYTVTNSGNVTLAGPVTVSDDKIASVTCPAVTTVGNNDGNLDPTETVVCTGDYTITQADLDAGSVTNTASASADGTTSPDDTATATGTQGPALTLVKAVTAGDPYSAVGDVVSYSYTVTNSGNVTLAGPVTVSDDKIASVTCPAVTTVGNNDGNLDPTETVVCTGDYTITQADLDAGSVTNTASASADGTTSPDDTATATGTQGPALTLVKAVTSGDPYAQVGEVVSYSYTVTNSGNVALAGPVVVADDKIVSVSCPAVSTVGNNDGNLDPSEAVVCTGDYTVTQADLDAGSVTNTASASADGTTSNEDTATATAAITAAIEGVVFEETSAGYDGLLTSELLTNGGGLYVCLDTNPARFAQVGSVTTGAFEFSGLQPGASYNLVLTTENGGSTCPATSTLNTNWYSTGESEDGLVTDSVVISGETLSDGKLAVTVPQVTRSRSVLGATAVTFGLARASVFDPPFGLKTGEFLEGQPVIRWTMVWINDSPIPVTGAVITDPPPTGTSYVDGSVSCEGRGTTTHSVCNFDSVAGQLQVVADFGPETGSPVDEDTADNELIIRFDVTYDAVNPEPEYLNQGILQWNDGSGNQTATTDDPTVTGDNDPSVVVPVIIAVTPVPSLPLHILGLMILCVGWYGSWRLRLF